MATFTYTNPTVGGSEDTWGATLNANWTALGAFFGSLDSTELAQLDGNTFTGGLTVQSGNAGIGTSSPNQLLHVESSGFAGVKVESTGVESDPQLFFTNDNGGASEWSMRLDKNASDVFQLRYNNNQRLTVDTDGNVGIGTVTPSEKLEVNGTVKATSFEGGFPELTQVQVEDDTSTVFGQVSGQRLAQATAATLNATGSAPIYACRAWVNFNGTGTVAIRASGNVSSITDNGVGSYTINIANAIEDANYCILTTAGVANSKGDMTVAGVPTTTAFSVLNGVNSAYFPVDPEYVYAAVLR